VPAIGRASHRHERGLDPSGTSSWRAVTRAAAERILQWPIRRIAVGHGEPYDAPDARAQLTLALTRIGWPATGSRIDRRRQPVPNMISLVPTSSCVRIELRD